jgi:uncharacterized protein (DUF697 family)
LNSSPPSAVLRLYERLTGLLEKLPGGLHKPILRELEPIRAIFLGHRPPHLELVGEAVPCVPSLLASLGANHASTGESHQGWRDYSNATGSLLEILDARDESPDSPIQSALEYAQPDLVLLVLDSEPDASSMAAVLARALASGKPILALTSNDSFLPCLNALIHSDPLLAEKTIAVLAITDPTCPEILCASLPLEAQLEFARFTAARRAQAFIASQLLKSFSAVCGVVGLQPIPLADLPVLFALQSLMVGLIIHTSGRPVSPRLVAEFFAALGINAAVGFALREGARAAIRLVPFWGSAVSGFVAGAGTYALGRAAIAYFIDDTPLQETRRLFQKMLRRQNP